MSSRTTAVYVTSAWLFLSTFGFGGCGSDPESDGTGGSVSDPDASVGSGGSGGSGGSSGTSTELLGVVDLPRVPETQGLSGTFFDSNTRTLLAIQDKASRLVPFAVSEDLHSFTQGEPIEFTGRPSSVWDGEAIVRVGSEILAVTDETTPLLERFDASGNYLGKVEVPAIYQEASHNQGLESLTVSPSFAFLFTANEAALTLDGDVASKTEGTLVRILRRDLGSTKDEARAYRTEPLGAGTDGDMGVSELLAVSDTELLVLERGYQEDYGNTVRLFLVNFVSEAENVLSAAALDASTPVLEKTLVVDLAQVPSTGVTNPGLQPNPVLDNFEGLSFGPMLDDGRQVVLVTSDDNGNEDQVPRILVLALALP